MEGSLTEIRRSTPSPPALVPALGRRHLPKQLPPRVSRRRPFSCLSPEIEAMSRALRERSTDRWRSRAPPVAGTSCFLPTY
jgi:hypothetical protein